jgi:hypothetical protein
MVSFFGSSFKGSGMMPSFKRPSRKLGFTPIPSVAVAALFSGFAAASFI